MRGQAAQVLADHPEVEAQAAVVHQAQVVPVGRARTMTVPAGRGELAIPRPER